MTYKTIPSALDTPADFERIGKTANYYADGKFFIEVYNNGTCVFPRVQPGKDVESGANLLVEVGGRPIDFVVKEMDDHNFVVRFSDAVFSIVFQDEFAEHRGEIVRQAENAGGDEVLMGKPGAPQDHMLIGLYARTRLLADLQVPAVARAIAPAPSK
jgi:hypothetical protein